MKTNVLMMFLLLFGSNIYSQRYLYNVSSEYYGLKGKVKKVEEFLDRDASFEHFDGNPRFSGKLRNILEFNEHGNITRTEHITNKSIYIAETVYLNEKSKLRKEFKKTIITERDTQVYVFEYNYSDSNYFEIKEANDSSTLRYYFNKQELLTKVERIHIDKSIEKLEECFYSNNRLSSYTYTYTYKYKDEGYKVDIKYDQKGRRKKTKKRDGEGKFLSLSRTRYKGNKYRKFYYVNKDKTLNSKTERIYYFDEYNNVIQSLRVSHKQHRKYMKEKGMLMNEKKITYY